VDATNPRFSFEVAGALAGAARIEEADMAAPRAFRAATRAMLDALLDGRRVLCLPTTPILPIRRDARLSEMRLAVDRIVHLTCIAGLTGLPQVSLPLAGHGGVPVGLSLIGWRGSDSVLLALAKALSPPL
jgi:amidase